MWQNDVMDSGAEGGLKTRTAPAAVRSVSPEELELWRRYRGKCDVAARDSLVQRHLPLVHYLANQLARRTRLRNSIPDLVSAGSIGLLHAVERFDPSRGYLFSTFAARRIRGAMLDEVRSESIMSRGTATKARMIGQARARVEGRLGRSAREADMVLELGLEVGEYRTWEREAQQVEVTLEVDVPARQGADSVESTDRSAWLADAIRQLPENERKVLALTFYEDLPGREIANILGVTESRVSQIKTKALQRLRTGFDAKGSN